LEFADDLGLSGSVLHDPVTRAGSTQAATLATRTAAFELGLLRGPTAKAVSALIVAAAIARTASRLRSTTLIGAATLWCTATGGRCAGIADSLAVATTASPTTTAAAAGAPFVSSIILSGLDAVIAFRSTIVSIVVVAGAIKFDFRARARSIVPACLFDGC
jgi:hypothetical protein